MVRVLASTLLAAATLTACASERDISTYDENGYQVTEQNDLLNDYGDYSNLDVLNATTFGRMGPVSDISGLASARGYRESEPGFEFTEVNVVTTNNRGSAMHILYLEGDLSQLERGQKYTFNNDSYYDEGATTVYATSTNCAGTGEPGAWDYDTPADEVSVVVNDTPQGTQVQYETVSYDALFGSDVSGGEFILSE